MYARLIRHHLSRAEPTIRDPVVNRYRELAPWIDQPSRIVYRLVHVPRMVENSPRIDHVSWFELHRAKSGSRIDRWMTRQLPGEPARDRSSQRSRNRIGIDIHTDDLAGAGVISAK